MEPTTPNRLTAAHMGSSVWPNLEEIKSSCRVEKTRTFLDVNSFEYSQWVASYCNRETRPMDNPRQFLKVLEAILQVTDTTIYEASQEYQQSFKKAIRQRFLFLYRDNQRDLFMEIPSSEVHQVVTVALASSRFKVSCTPQTEEHVERKIPS